ncbi:MAG: ECF transporter S component [Anaerolineales bacterium]|nr:ECF transporter S component [Anaerolineales bacterium]
MLEKFKQDFRPITWILIPIAVIVNGAGGWIIAKLDVPFYMDTVGTIFVAIVAGPFAGALTGVLTNMGLGLVSPSYIPYWPVPLLIGLMAGLFANAGWFKQWWKVVIVGIFIAIIAAFTSTLIAAKIFGEFSISPLYFLVEEPLDKIVTTLIAFGVAKLLPTQVLALLPRPENIVPKEK